jgi:formylglycine-generating enzyme required for sulfatase activity
LLANDDLPAGLKLCKELLPEGGEKHKLILAMQAQLHQLNKDRMKGLISQEDYARRLAIIVDSFINFIPELETTDFDFPATSADASSGNSPQTGSVLYRVPHSMPLQKASICTIRIAIDEDAILEDIIIDADVRLKEKVEVSERMSAELLDIEGRVFDIKPFNTKDQMVRPTGYTQWLFRVTPLMEGQHQLLVKVSLLEFDQNTKEYVPRDVSVLETVTVVTASQHSDEEEAPLKSAGPSFVMGPDATPDFNMKKESVNVESENSSGSNWLNGRPQRIAALFLAFLVFASSTTYAFTPKMTRDWWHTTWKDTPEAYQAFIDAHQADAPGGIKHPKIEKAYYYKAAASNELPDLREYQQLYADKGEFNEPVLEKIKVLEWEAVQAIQKEPSALNIQRYLTDFPDARRLTQVLEAAKTLPMEEQKVVLQQIENRFVTNNTKQISIKPTPKIRTTTPSTSEEGLPNTLTIQEKQNSSTDKTNSTFTDKTNSSFHDKKTEPLVTVKQETNTLEKKYLDKTPPEIVSQELLTEVKSTPTGISKDPFRRQMLLVKGGTFIMGSPDKDNDAENDEKPQHSVSLSDFSIGKYEVTQAQWRAVMGKDPEELSFKGCDQCPVDDVSWNDIQEFLKILNAKTGKKYRLPTEAEWEYAARGGNQSAGYTYAGSNALAEVAWYDDNSSGKTHLVGQKRANELGLYDMIGNVIEWCQDLKCTYSSTAQTNPTGAVSGSYRMLRGGSWYSTARYCRVSLRNYRAPTFRNTYVGFRLAL